MAEADPGILTGLTPVDEIAAATPAALDAALRTATAPFVVRGLVRDWPLVQAGLRSPREARDYILAHHRDLVAVVSFQAAR